MSDQIHMITKAIRSINYWWTSSKTAMIPWTSLATERSNFKNTKQRMADLWTRNPTRQPQIFVEPKIHGFLMNESISVQEGNSKNLRWSLRSTLKRSPTLQNHDSWIKLYHLPQKTMPTKRRRINKEINLDSSKLRAIMKLCQLLKIFTILLFQVQKSIWKIKATWPAWDKRAINKIKTMVRPVLLIQNRKYQPLQSPIHILNHLAKVWQQLVYLILSLLIRRRVRPNRLEERLWTLRSVSC